MKSILGKVWLGITSLIILILLIIWLFQIGLLNNFYINERRSILLKEGEKIASLFLESDDYSVVSYRVKEQIESFCSSYNAKIFIIDSHSNILFFNSSGDYFKDHKFQEQNLRRNLSIFYNDLEVRTKILEGKAFVVQKDHPRFKERKSILTGVPIKEDGKIIGTILLTSPLAPIEETISILKKQLSIITFISLIIGTLLALLFAKNFTGPIRKITETSRKIAKGDFSASVKLASKDEIGVLGDTINGMAKQLGQIENFRREFIANTSHELKTPISLITAYSELIRDMNIKEEDSKNQYLQIIIDEANRLNNMVEDILYLSKMETGYSKLKLLKFPVIEVISNVTKKLKFFADQKNIKINLEIDDKNTEIYGDRGKMHQVFYNIINNAINHSFKDSHITIKIINMRDRVRFEILDEGKGIPEEDLPYIWDRFYKVDKSRKRDDSGTGLGMAIVKNILEAHSFKYGIESQLDKGTIVWFEVNKDI
ncbi:MAG: cell wall metabolism sensor histidine kinase WalK [Clostridia bacterium]|nr:cell wall metabolism sensor histidine kinase WalK [Clostridia bacterium]